MENQLSKHDFLKKETWVNLTQRTVVTADITCADAAVGCVHHGFNKKILTEEELKKATFSRTEDPGDYVLENFPASGTILPDRLEYLSIDDAYSYIKESIENGDKISSWSYEDYDFGYQVALCRGYGPLLGESLAYETNDLEDALVFASIADGAAGVVEGDFPKAEKLENAEDWLYLDRSSYGYSNVHLNISDARIERIR